MEYLQEVVCTIIGVILGFSLYWIQDCIRERNSAKKYSNLIYFELKNLKKEIDKRVKAYDQLSNATCNKLGVDKEVLPYDPESEQHKFLLRLDFRAKYIYIDKNFDKVSILSNDSIKYLLNIYSLLEEFEEYRQISIRNIETKELDNTGMNNAEWLLIKNLKEVQNIIPDALISIKNEC